MSFKKLAYAAANIPLRLVGAELVRRRELIQYRNAYREEVQRKALAVDFAAQASILEIGELLSPRIACGHSLVRVGKANDGGYIFIDDFEPIGAVFSLGISNEVSCDEEFARRGIDVYQYDHTVDGPPVQNDRFHFEKLKVCAAPTAGGATLEEMLSKRQDDRPGILKIDIEGDEWDVFDAAPANVLSSFAQITGEFHDFVRCVDAGWSARALRVLKKLRGIFDVVHVHANNNGSFPIIGGVPFPDVLEVSFVNRSRYATQDGVRVFPTGLDTPNVPGKPDLALGCFRFEKRR